jgi:hypothetical protein
MGTTAGCTPKSFRIDSVLTPVINLKLPLRVPQTFDLRYYAIPTDKDIAMLHRPGPSLPFKSDMSSPVGPQRIELAETEMPGLMALRKKYGATKPLKGPASPVVSA